MYHVMGIREMEDRSLNREQREVETKFEAMSLARAYRAEGLDVVILNDKGEMTYASSVYWVYLFDEAPEVAVAKANEYVSSYYTPGGDVGTLWKVDLASPQHLFDLITQLRKKERKGRKSECVPVYNRSTYIRNKLLGGCLQYHGVPVGTTYKFTATDLVDWFNEVFADYVVFDGHQAVVVG